MDLDMNHPFVYALFLVAGFLAKVTYDYILGTKRKEEKANTEAIKQLNDTLTALNTNISELVKEVLQLKNEVTVLENYHELNHPGQKTLRHGKD